MDKAYRYEDRRYCTSLDERDPSFILRVQMVEFDVIKRTPRGFRIMCGGAQRFVRSPAKKTIRPSHRRRCVEIVHRAEASANSYSFYQAERRQECFRNREITARQMICLFNARCISTEHGPETCTTELLEHGWPSAPCIMCQVNTKGSTSLGPWRTPLCWKCFQRFDDDLILTRIAEPAAARVSGGSTWSEGSNPSARSQSRPPLRSAPRRDEDRPPLRSPPRH